jgi:NitT/TauT family transport system permease protein
MVTVSNMRARALTSWLPVVLILILIFMWQTAAYVLGPAYVPTPRATATEAVAQLIRGPVLDHLAATSLGLLYGFLLAAVLGLTVGLILGLSRKLYETYEPIVMSLYALPKLVIYPVFLFIFGLALSSRAWFAMTIGIFPIIIFAMDGTRSVDPVLLKVGRAFRLSRFRLFRVIVFPAALPSIVSGLRLGVGTTLGGVVLAEFISSPAGIGFALSQAVVLNNVVGIYALVMIVVVVALGLNSGLRWIEARVLREKGQERLDVV